VEYKWRKVVFYFYFLFEKEMEISLEKNRISY
jgi:hypothetical protein